MAEWSSICILTYSSYSATPLQPSLTSRFAVAPRVSQASANRPLSSSLLVSSTCLHHDRFCTSIHAASILACRAGRETSPTAHSLRHTSVLVSRIARLVLSRPSPPSHLLCYRSIGHHCPRRLAVRYRSRLGGSRRLQPLARRS